MRSLFFLGIICLLFAFSTNSVAQFQNTNNKCILDKHVKNIIDSLSKKLDHDEIVIFSVQFIRIADSNNYWVALSISKKLTTLKLIDDVYYSKYMEHYILLHNYSNDYIAGSIIEYFCDYKKLDVESSIRIILQLSGNKQKNLRPDLENWYDIEMKDGIYSLMVRPRRTG